MVEPRCLPAGVDVVLSLLCLLGSPSSSFLLRWRISLSPPMSHFGVKPQANLAEGESKEEKVLLVRAFCVSKDPDGEVFDVNMTGRREQQGCMLVIPTVIRKQYIQRNMHASVHLDNTVMDMVGWGLASAPPTGSRLTCSERKLHFRVFLEEESRFSMSFFLSVGATQ
ncbi:hypothetical protein FQN60_008607 [Etheostoma spectabile]|uniref:Uncharacterized protein n=1 Tax=Etheostoma spectabile TaxID=54343 RepID=A0A5J5CJK5_9PERO|nr:hypothetical protein FQN60_008607 [Etheostoma spectabile]